MIPALELIDMRNPRKARQFSQIVGEACGKAGLGADFSDARNACRLVAATMAVQGTTDLPYGSTVVFQDALEAAIGRRPSSQSMRWYASKVRTDASAMAAAFDFPPEWRELLVCGP
ncbi:hypothetical protein HOY34_13025 [Xinfangfangia sp. D13-10-4-6]|uniref:hypothetical protein n=1 Tax=Pseudogemmobacter hezensis TaxID=2737662 RepID=UPI00155283FD|nr:hypothetical protein [Pseudogemmobacter hezensis]NPD16121.1 hypothetical protein [Pseudogemmobacter hezensis]